MSSPENSPDQVSPSHRLELVLVTYQSLVMFVCQMFAITYLASHQDFGLFACHSVVALLQTLEILIIIWKHNIAIIVFLVVHWVLIYDGTFFVIYPSLPIILANVPIPILMVAFLVQQTTGREPQSAGHEHPV